MVAETSDIGLPPYKGCTDCMGKSEDEIKMVQR